MVFCPLPSLALWHHLLLFVYLYRVLKELAELIDVNSFEDGNGAVAVLTANGRPLVSATQFWQLSTETNIAGLQNVVWVDDGGNKTDITTDISGGRLKGYLDVRDGVIDELSIGFDPIKWEMEQKDANEQVRHIKELRLWEISAVTFAADPMAKIHTVHAVVPYQDLPLADEGRAWSGSSAHNRLVSECGCDGDSPDWAKFKKAHLWYDPAKTEEITGYKFQIADVIDGKLQAVPRGIFAAAAILQGARGGTKVPQADQDKMKAHLARYYKSMNRTAPWDEEKDSLEFDIETLCTFIPFFEIHKGAILSAKNKRIISDIIKQLQAFYDAAEPPEDEQALTVKLEMLDQLRNAELAFAHNFNFKQ